MSYAQNQFVTFHQKRQAVTKLAPPVKKGKHPPPLDYVGTLRSWWNSLPPATRAHPWELKTIIAAAFAGQRTPCRWLVGQALRSLGWVSKRDWTNAGRNRRQWVPPQD